MFSYFLKFPVYKTDDISCVSNDVDDRVPMIDSLLHPNMYTHVYVYLKYTMTTN